MVNDEEYNNKVFEQFQDKYKDFKTSFVILLGFAVIFFFIILLPHFSLLYEKNYLSERISQTKQDLKLLEIANNETIELRNNVSNFTKNLRQYIILNKVDVSSLNYTKLNEPNICVNTSIQNISSSEECKIINNILVSLNLSTIINPISSISDESSNTINASGLSKDLTSLSEDVNSILFNNLSLIRTVQGKMIVGSQLSDEINYTLSSENAKTLNENVIQKMQEILINKNGTLTNKINKIKELDNLVQDRVSQLNTPIGQLPITLQEAISIFPFSLGIGSLISTSLLLECLKLRDKMRNYFNKQGLTDNDIASIASPWIDKIKSKKDRKIKFLILIIPFVIFIVSSILIGFEWMLQEKLNETTDIIWTFPGNKETNYTIFSISYLISLIFFI